MSDYSLNYINNKYTITNNSENTSISFSNSLLIELFPDLAASSNTQQIIYKLGNTNNKITYINGTTHELSWDEDKYNQIILKKQHLCVASYEKVQLEKRNNFEVTRAKYNVQQFFDLDISLAEREERILEYQSKTGIIITDEILINALDKIKKRLLLESDWSQLPDVQSLLSEEDKQSWLNYRTELRSLDESDFPRKVIIPSSPEFTV